MAFAINTNVHALNSRAQGTFTQRNLQDSLERLSSGLRINKAADDASGMAIADSLRSQANSLGQAIRNTNDGIGIIQIADKAMDEQVKILDSIKTKAVQAAQDGQTTKTRTAIQADITRLVQSLDNIGNTTSYNGLALLSGSFTNKEFQVGAYSNQSIKGSIGATTSDKIGHVRVETGAIVSADGSVALQVNGVPGNKNMILESVVISTSAGTGLGALAEVINKNSDALGGIKASFVVETTGQIVCAVGALQATASSASLETLVINGVDIGRITDILDNDRDGKIVNAINARKEETGVQASVDYNGRLHLTAMDGRGIHVVATNISGTNVAASLFGVFSGNGFYGGRLTLTKLDASDIRVTGTGIGSTGFSIQSAVAETSVNLRGTLNAWDANKTSAMGANASLAIAADNATGMSAGVTTLRGAMVVMNIAESAIKQLDSIRSDLGSMQQQMTSTLNNITITQVNVKSAESNIRDTDFAEESSSYTKLNLLSQSGNYALSQANAVQQNIMRLLQ
ncbi:MAG: flagellin B [Helicobacter sp.]|nr:flagellin B [Helicobacter sp.]